VKTAKSDALLDGGKEGGKSQKETNKEGDQHKPRAAIVDIHRLKVEVVTKSMLAMLIAFCYSDMNKIICGIQLRLFSCCGSGSGMDAGLRIRIHMDLHLCRKLDPDPH
jgi:hypothetical protein